MVDLNKRPRKHWHADQCADQCFKLKDHSQPSEEAEMAEKYGENEPEWEKGDLRTLLGLLDSKLYEHSNGKELQVHVERFVNTYGNTLCL